MKIREWFCGTEEERRAGDRAGELRGQSRLNRRKQRQLKSSEKIAGAINRRRVLTGSAAVAVVAFLGAAKFLFREGSDDIDDEGSDDEQESRVDSPRNIVEALRPYIRNNFPMTESQRMFELAKDKMYPITKDISLWIEQLRRVGTIGFGDVSPEEKEQIAILIDEVMNSGVFEELQKLRSKNESEITGKKLDISVVPLEHWSPKDGSISGSAMEVARDVDAIVRAIRKFSPGSKLFMEGIDVDRPITEQLLLNSIAGMNKRYVRSVNPRDAGGFKVLEKHYPWLLDGRSEVYGTEHRTFYQGPMRRLGSRDFRGKVSLNSQKILIILFRHFLREQLAVERAVSKLSDGERGYIFCGAAHTRGILEYLDDRYRDNVKAGALVPKHLVLRD